MYAFQPCHELSRHSGTADATLLNLPISIIPLEKFLI